MRPVPQSVISDPVAARSVCPPPILTGTTELLEMPRLQPQPIAIRNLHPTQMTVGFREVAERRRRWQLASGTVEAAARDLTVPVVLGPCARSYVLDRHHELCALAAEGVADVQVAVVDDMRRFGWVGFWRTLDQRGWCRPQDAEGQRQNYSYIPTTIDGLTDDPFRSLARALRRADGYAKQKAPFSDFLWADFLRQRISRTLINGDFEMALQEALALARNGGPATLQGTKIDLRPKTLGMPTKFSASGFLDTVSTAAARDHASAEHVGTMT